MQSSRQIPRAGVEDAHTSTPFSSIEIARPIYDKLNEICLVEKIPLKTLASRLLAHMLTYHRIEVSDIIGRIKHPEAW